MRTIITEKEISEIKDMVDKFRNMKIKVKPVTHEENGFDDFISARITVERTNFNKFKILLTDTKIELITNLRSIVSNGIEWIVASEIEWPAGRHFQSDILIDNICRRLIINSIRRRHFED